MKKKKFLSRDNQAYLYLLPWIVGMLVLQIYPFITSFYYSLTEYNALTDPKFVGLANYVRLFTRDKEFFKSLSATVTYTALTVPFKIIMSLFIAILLNKGRKGIGALRTIYYLPSLFGGSMAVSILWKIMFMDDGMINAFLHRFGFETVSFLGNPATALPTLSALEIWQFGSSMLIFAAGLKEIPISYYEAAEIDGAGTLRIFWYIITPVIKPILATIAIFAAVNQWNAFQDTLLLVTDTKLHTLQYVLYNYINAANSIKAISSTSSSCFQERFCALDKRGSVRQKGDG